MDRDDPKSGEFAGMEPISPELVMIDTELRERALALLPEQLEPSASPALPQPTLPITARAAPRRAARSRIRLGGALLLGASLFVNGYLAAHLLTRSTPSAAQESSSVAFAPPVVTVGTPSTSVVAQTSAPTKRSKAPKRSTASQRSTAPRRTAPVSRVTLERRVLSLVLSLPANKLPRRLTGGTSLQSICEHDGPVNYACIVRPAQHKPGEGLTIRYVNGRFKLDGYRSG